MRKAESNRNDRTAGKIKDGPHSGIATTAYIWRNYLQDHLFKKDFVVIQIDIANMVPMVNHRVPRRLKASDDTGCPKPNTIKIFGFS